VAVTPSFKEALKFWLKLGFISFGGPAGQISIMHEFLVEKKKWISPSKFLHALNYCNILPGPEAQQLAIYTGWLLHGMRGGLAGGILFVLPSVFILLALSICYVVFGKIAWVYAFFQGLKPAVIAIIILALIKIGSRALQSLRHYIIAILSFIAIYFLNIPFPYIIIGSIVIGIVYMRLQKNKTEAKKENDIATEKEYVINNYSVLTHTAFNKSKLLKLTLIFTGLWAVPFFFMNVIFNNTPFWNQLNLFFTKAAFVTFGGAYAVLPYVAQVTVFKFGWLTNTEMIDGLALGESTPGPLIMVLTFVGFMAAYNYFSASVLMGTIGLLLTTWFTFLPCFYFVFAGAPIIERTQKNEKIKNLLQFVTATVVGVLLNLVLIFGKAVVFEPAGINFYNIIWIVISILVLKFTKTNMILWLVASGLAAVLFYFIF